MPCIENLLRAFAAQDEAQRSTTNSGEFERGVSSTLTELHMAINANMSQPDGFPDINMSSRADRLDGLYRYFFEHYLRTLGALLHELSLTRSSSFPQKRSAGRGSSVRK